MYPTISDLMFDLFGVDIPLPIQSFGFFVAIAFMVAFYFFKKEMMRRQELGFIQPYIIKTKEGEKPTFSSLLINFTIGFLMGFKIVFFAQNYLQYVNKPHEVIFSPLGNVPAGIILGIAYAGYFYWKKNKEALPKPKEITTSLNARDIAGKLLIVFVFCGFIGSKIFHTLENLDDLFHEPLQALFSFSGLSVYGGILLCFAAAYHYSKKLNISFWTIMDSGILPLIIGYAIGRIGCHVSGDGDWGIPNNNPMPPLLSFLPEWLWAYDYPNNVLGVDLKEYYQRIGYECQTPCRAYPTPMYEVLMNGMFFVILWRLRKRITRLGILTALGIMVIAVNRFLIEKIRINNTFKYFGIEFTQAELISIILFSVGIWLIFYFRKNGEKIPKALKK